MNNCKNCGAPIHNGKCEYCGTEYPVEIPIRYVESLGVWRLKVFSRPHFAAFRGRDIELFFKCSNCASALRMVFRVGEDELRYAPWWYERVKAFTQTEKLDFCEKCAARMTRIEVEPWKDIDASLGNFLPYILTEAQFGTRDLPVKVLYE